jgi:hypothetical protein
MKSEVAKKCPLLPTNWFFHPKISTPLWLAAYQTIARKWASLFGGCFAKYAEVKYHKNENAFFCKFWVWANPI